MVTLTTSTNTNHTFDEVVITCPLGWLKRNHSNAFPPSLLPTRLKSAITDIGYGRLEKVYVTFPSAFWLPEAPRFTEFLHPTYIESLPPDVTWNQGSMSLAHLPDTTAQPTLLFYLYGPCATHIVASLASHDPSSPKCTLILEEFTHPFISRLPDYTSTSPDCRPVAYLATSWQTDPFAGHGSYTNFPTGLTDAAKDVECMRDAGGLGENCGIWLAGEHTAPFVALGTTTGAHWAGEGVARRICKEWGVNVAEEEGEKHEREKDLEIEKHNTANLNDIAIS